MAYTRKRYTFCDSNEYEYSYCGNYGARGEPREKKKKATPEQIAKQNLANKKKAIRRLIKANFTKRDYWITLKYPKGARPSIEEVMKDWDGFIRRMKARYRKEGSDLKWIRRIEIGKRGGVHAHVIINRLDETDLMIKECWKAGGVNFETLYGDYDQLADYLAKDEAPEEQMSLFDEKDKKKLKNYSHSRNLVKVEPQVKKYEHWTMRRILRDGPKPTPGYYIVKDSVKCGINPYTGMSYLQYTENRLDTDQNMAKTVHKTAKNVEKQQKTSLNGKKRQSNHYGPHIKEKNTERRTTGMQVSIYVSISNRAVARQTDGTAGYVIATPTAKGDATLTDFVYIPSMTKNRAEICALNSALKRLKKGCDIELFTDSAYLKSGLSRLEEYIESGWHKRDGEPVKFAQDWKITADLLKEQTINVHVKEQNEYAGWLSDAVTRLADRMKEERKDEMEEKELKELVRQLKRKEF